jgi:GT2 family glycosyltransferase
MINYNGEKYLKRTIPPILNLNYPNYEFIIIDNQSSDNSLEIISRQKKIILINNEVKGSKNRALNLGIKKSKGEYILFLDNDVIIKDKDLLQDILESFFNFKKIGLITLTLQNEGEKKVALYGQYLKPITFTKQNKELDLVNIKEINGKNVVGVQGAAFFCKKIIFSKIGYFDEVIPFGGEDIDVGIRSILFGFQNLIYSNKVLIHIGMGERNDLKKNRSKYFKGFTGWFITIIKNYKFFNAIFLITFFSIFLFLKTIKSSIQKKDPLLIFLYFMIPLYIILNIKKIIFSRNEIQSKRIIKEDVFLKIKPPKINK